MVGHRRTLLDGAGRRTYHQLKAIIARKQMKHQGKVVIGAVDLHIMLPSLRLATIRSGNVLLKRLIGSPFTSVGVVKVITVRVKSYLRQCLVARQFFPFYFQLLLLIWR